MIWVVLKLSDMASRTTGTKVGREAVTRVRPISSDAKMRTRAQ
jgi:hypothetical protein